MIPQEKSSEPKDEPIVLSFNWTSWPFVEVGDEHSLSLREQLHPALVSDLEAWCEFMLQNYNEDEGFLSAEAEQFSNAEYLELAGRLEASKIRFITINWWS